MLIPQRLIHYGGTYSLLYKTRLSTYWTIFKKYQKTRKEKKNCPKIVLGKIKTLISQRLIHYGGA